MQNTPKAKDENLNNKSSGIQNLPHFQMINKSKSTNERANISLNLNIQKRDQNNESTMQKNKKEIIFPTPKLSPQKKAVIPRLYEVCDADTFESIATKFSIPESWLIRQNIKLINDPHFILSKGIKLNVTEPSHSMIKPLDCSLVNGESHNDAQESTEDDELGQNGKIYVVINENSFDFIPDTVSKEHKPLHIKLSSLNDDAVIYTPKLQREKMKKKMQNEQLVTANNSAQERAENKETTDLEEHDKKMENVEQSIPTTEEAKSSPTLQEDFIEVEKSDENGSKQEIQEKCEEIVKVDAQESVCEQSNKAETEKVVMEASQIEKEKVDGSETVHVDQIATETKELTNNSAPEQSSEKDSVLVVSYLLNPRDESSLNALYFRVRKEEGNKFSDSLQKAIKEAKQRAKARLEKHKHDQIPKPNIPPSPSSPLSFFQSIFSTIKDSFSHLNDEIIGPTINNNNNDNNNNDDDSNVGLNAGGVGGDSNSSIGDNPYDLSKYVNIGEARRESLYKMCSGVPKEVVISHSGYFAVHLSLGEKSTIVFFDQNMNIVAVRQTGTKKVTSNFNYNSRNSKNSMTNDIDNSKEGFFDEEDEAGTIEIYESEGDLPQSSRRKNKMKIRRSSSFASAAANNSDGGIQCWSFFELPDGRMFLIELLRNKSLRMVTVPEFSLLWQDKHFNKDITVMRLVKDPICLLLGTSEGNVFQFSFISK